MKELRDISDYHEPIIKGINSLRNFKVVCGDFTKEYRNMKCAIKAYFKHLDRNRECYIFDTFFESIELCNKFYKDNIDFNVSNVVG